MWKIQRAQIREEIYKPWIYKVSANDTGTGELLYIDQYILNGSKTRRENLAMAWIDYKKEYDMVS